MLSKCSSKERSFSEGTLAGSHAKPFPSPARFIGENIYLSSDYWYEGVGFKNIQSLQSRIAPTLHSISVRYSQNYSCTLIIILVYLVMYIAIHCTVVSSRAKIFSIDEFSFEFRIIICISFD